MKQGWEMKKLGDVCEIKNGGTPKTGNKEYWGGDIKWITPKDLGKLGNRYVKDTPRKITKLGLQKSSAKLIPANSIILSTRAPIGHIAINSKEMATNQGCRGIIPSKKITEEYLYYFLGNSVKLLNELGTGATFRELSTRALASVEIPLPSLPEQQRIVAILDKAFIAIATVKANAEQNLLNAKELFESYLQGVFENKGDDSAKKADRWEEKRFDQICVLQRGFDLPKRLRKEGDYPLVSSNGITDFIDIWKVKSPGVSTGRSGTIGKIHFIEKDYFPLNTSLYIKEFHGNDEKCIYYFLKKFDLSRFQSGAGVPTLNRNNVHCVKVYFPNSIKEQQQIVKKLNSLSAETKKLESIYQQKINDLEELKKALLQRAFNGELSIINDELTTNHL